MHVPIGRLILVFGGLLTTIVAAKADDWPQWRGPRRDGVWRESGIVETLPEKLTYKWRTPISSGYAGPAVANGKIYVSDRYLKKGEQNPDNPFDRRAVTGFERIWCLDEQSGKVVWKHEYPCRYTLSYPYGPRATPTVDKDRVYVVGAMGDFFCFNADTGKIVWSKNYVEDYGTEMNAWGMSAAPLIDGDHVVLLVGGQRNACVVALDKHDGAEVWRSLEERDPGYCPPVIINEGGVRQLIVWTPSALNSLDPATGKVYWEQPFALKSSLSIPTPIFDKERHLLFVSAFYNGPMMMRLSAKEPKASILWKGSSNNERRTDGLHALMCTPAFVGDHLYGVGSYGQLRCLNSLTGERVWETFDATGEGRWWNAFLIRHNDRFFIANEQGDLITARLTPQGYEETSRAFLIKPTNRAARRQLVWSHPAFANKCVFARNDEEIVCVDLAASN